MIWLETYLYQGGVVLIKLLKLRLRLNIPRQGY